MDIKVQFSSNLKYTGFQAFYDTLTTPTVLSSKPHLLNVNHLIDIGQNGAKFKSTLD